MNIFILISSIKKLKKGTLKTFGTFKYQHRRDLTSNFFRVKILKESERFF